MYDNCLFFSNFSLILLTVSFCLRLSVSFFFCMCESFFYQSLFVWLFMFCIVYILYFQEVFSIFMCQIAIWKRTRLYGPLLCLSVMFALPYAIAWITLTSSYGTKALVFTLYVKLKLLNNWNINVNFLTSISHNLISRTNLALKMANLLTKFVQNPFLTIPINTSVSNIVVGWRSRKQLSGYNQILTL